MPRQPADRTFVAAISVLGLVAFAQLIAAAVAVVPSLRLSPSALGASAKSPDAPIVAAAPQPTPDAAAMREVNTIMQAQQYIDQAVALRDQGNFDAALHALAQSDKLHPNEPITYFETAQTLEAAGKLTEAIDLLRRAQPLVARSNDPTYRQLKAEIAARLGKLTGTAVDADSPPPNAPTAEPGSQPPVPGAEQSALRDEVGIPIGSTFGIVDCRVGDEEPGFKIIRVATKANPKEKIDRDALQVAIFCYEKDATGEIVKTTANLPNYWLDPKIDWADGEPEVLEIRYPLPKDAGTSLAYYGYVVGVYYKGELQDSRAEPVALLDQFPLKLYLTDSPQ